MRKTQLRYHGRPVGSRYYVIRDDETGEVIGHSDPGRSRSALVGPGRYSVVERMYWLPLFVEPQKNQVDHHPNSVAWHSIQDCHTQDELELVKGWSHPELLDLVAKESESDLWVRRSLAAIRLGVEFSESKLLLKAALDASEFIEVQRAATIGISKSKLSVAVPSLKRLAASRNLKNFEVAGLARALLEDLQLETQLDDWALGYVRRVTGG